MTDAERLLAKVLVSSGCWLWGGATDDRGYGFVWLGGRTRRAHRAVYELLVGPIPDGLELDHTCRVHGCVRPSHLEPVTHAENVRRGLAGENNRSKTSCLRGHPLTSDNRGKRVCRECGRERSREWYRANRAKS